MTRVTHGPGSADSRSRVLLHLVAPWLALGSGIVWGTCFGRHPMLILPWIALAPLLLCLQGKRPRLLAFLHGLGAWLISLSWIVATLETYGGLPRWVAVTLLLLLASYLALYHLAFAALGGWVWRQSSAVVLATLPALWVVLEVLRTHLLSGFPWNLAAYAWVEFPGALALSAWVGSLGLSYLLVFANAGVAVAVCRRRWEPLALGVLLPLLLFSLAHRWAPGSSPSQGGGAVRIVQPNVANLVEWDAERVLANHRKLLDLSQQGCDRTGALLVWPESAAWPYVLDRHEQLQKDLARLADLGCPVLLNSPRHEEDRVFNSVLLVGTEGTLGHYDKVHLVPFGEYVPLKRLLPFVGKLARNAGDFSAGAEPQLLSWEGESMGVSLCYEVIFPGEVAERVAAGATLLVTLTNDAWYGDTWAPWQHFRAARFRAAENRRPLLRAAITGVSAVIAADGSVQEVLGVFEQGVIAAHVVGEQVRTLYTRLPWLIPLLCALWVGFVILWVKGVKP